MTDQSDVHSVLKMKFQRILAASLCSVFILILVTNRKVFTNLTVELGQPAVQPKTANLPSNTNGKRLQDMTKSLTRLGSELKHFDAKKCPPGSIFWNVTNVVPKYSNCPALIIVGTPKGGTTSMFRYISMHPDFVGANLHTKEVGYFMRGDLTWNQYIKHFPVGVVAGEQIAEYISVCTVPRQIFQHCGRKSKVVMLFRNPVHRITSFYLFKRMRNRRVQISIDHHVNSQMNKYNPAATQLQLCITNTTHKQCCMPKGTNDIYDGLYYLQLLNWLCNFPAENIMIINSEEFYQYPPRAVTQVLHFIGLTSLSAENYTAISSTVYNKGLYDEFNTTMSDELNKQLHNLYHPFNEALFELLHWKNIDWD